MSYSTNMYVMSICPLAHNNRKEEEMVTCIIQWVFILIRPMC